MNDKTWPHQYDPQYFSARPDCKNNSKFYQWHKTLTKFNTPDTLHNWNVKKQENWTKIKNRLHKRYWSGVGPLLYIDMNSWPEMSNVVHDMSKCVGKVNMIYYKAILSQSIT